VLQKEMPHKIKNSGRTLFEVFIYLFSVSPYVERLH